MNSGRRPPKPRTDPPERLSDEQWLALGEWAMSREPWAVAELEDLTDACLDHHRARGNVMADWLAACRTWVRNERLWRRRGGPDGPPPKSRARGVAGAAREVARHLGLFGDEG